MEFEIDGHTIVLRNGLNLYGDKWFSFYIFDKCGKCVLLGDHSEHKELNQELAERIYQVYLNHQKRTEAAIKEGKMKPLSERMKSINPDSPLMRLMQKTRNRQ